MSVVTVAACGAAGATAPPSVVTAATGEPSSPATGPGLPGTIDASPPGATGPAVPTSVPGGVTPSPGPAASRIPSTQTDWGAILDGLPASFPIYPGVTPAEPPSEPVSGAFDTSASVDQVARWYRSTFADLGFSLLDLSAPLEDGSRVLDVQSDLPECRMQLTFRPLGESTMITVLYGAGCAGSEP